ncbi:MAG: UDP-glucose 4,6-dehydratase [Parcubacteria bacterium C7867-003]|nr:MAG: UDP-glucose 4,6-dehydratase [Parcubacteria bacterium C7867-003]
MKIYILGASGFMGSGMAEYLKSKGNEVFTERVDVTDLSKLREVFNKTKPEVVINFAGVRAYPNIDWCEDHKQETVAVNVSGAINAMLSAIEVGAYPIQISSGCVYSGDVSQEFTEDDIPNFHGSFYSRMRIVLENSLKELPVLYLRLRMPISYKSNPRNTINKIISYTRVISVPNSVTLVEDMYPAIEHLINKKVLGVLNLTNEGYVTHGQILEAYKKHVKPDHNFELITPEELEKSVTKTGRSNCVLSMEKAKSLGVVMPAVDEKRLEEIMLQLKQTLNI